MQPKVSPTELRRMLDSSSAVELIDVRSPGEFAAGHIPTAVNIPMEQLESRLADVGREVVLICQGGTRARTCCEWIANQRSAAVLEGGTNAWHKAGYPLVKNSRSRWSLERQVRLGAGLLVLLGTVMSLVGSYAWVFLAMFVGTGLTFAGLTDICGMGLLLARMPWNRAIKTGKSVPGSLPNCCS